MTTQGYANPDLLVDTDWLEAHLDDPNIRVIDCDVFDVYRRAHIKNAVGIPVHHYIKEPGYDSDPQAHPLVAPPDVMTELMQKMGIGDETLVVAYDANGSLNAARFWWVLNYHGHTNVKVLNGGWPKWFSEGKPASLGRPPDVGEVTFTSKVNSDVVCTLDYGVSQVGDSDTVCLDVRSAEAWDGSNERGNSRQGAVRGSGIMDTADLTTQRRVGRVKPASELRAMLEEVGATPDKQVITY